VTALLYLFTIKKKLLLQVHAAMQIRYLSKNIGKQDFWVESWPSSSLRNNNEMIQVKKRREFTEM